MTINAARLAAIFVAAVMLSSCATTPEPTPSTTTSTQASTSPTAIAGTLAELPGYTTTSIAAVDVYPTFTGSQFSDVTAAIVSQRGDAVLRVVVGRLESGNSDAFVESFLSDLSDRMAQANPPKTVATESEQLDGHSVTHFNVAAGTEGYTYAQGSTVAIAISTGGLETDASRDAFAKILANLT
ncbi:MULTISPECIES: hypothetical protein [unclassified Mycobacterium]|uniref:hypothetical protein n=1 Tax=unclassified Mycobacterium TaxID=2642494 RepID=UPI0029C790E1|nr:MULTISPECIES: hypothetical protein [unclassified Mycobacterium]